MNSYDKYISWLNDPYFDTEIRKELLDIEHDTSEIEYRFGKELVFGTGGLRGTVGAGTNRMNIYMVRKVSQGLADHIADKHMETRGIVIGYDSRRNSEQFAAEAAGVFAVNGIPVYLFSKPRPTPMLSFAIRYFNAAAGVMITASHNPKEYNGYKVYSEDGAQLSDTGAVADSIGKVEGITNIRILDMEGIINSGLLHMVGGEMDDAYLSSVKSLFAGSEFIKKHGSNIRIVYTPLHGVGGEMVMRALKETGFADVHVVGSQFLPDGDFPTAHETLNPEDREVYEHALALAKNKHADLIIATDPDCDRMGVMVRKGAGRYVLLSGNEAGALMLEYILQTTQTEKLKNSFIAKTIVTTRLADMIAKDQGVDTEEVLTGFKYIGELIRKLHDTGEKTFVFGMEDSCGYLVGTDVRDKDGVIGCMLIAKAAAWYKSKGMSLYKALTRLYKKYGWFSGELVTYPVHSDKALVSLKQTLFCDTDGTMFKGLGITAVRNYSLQLRHDLIKLEYSKLTLPKSDAVYYELPDGWFCIRPSGTEPKIKIYYELHADSKEAVTKRFNCIKKSVTAEISKYIQD